MSLKDQLIEKIESRIDAWEKEAETRKAEAKKRQAEAKADKADAELESELTEKIRSLQANIETARDKLNEIKTAGEDRMETFKREVKDLIG